MNAVLGRLSLTEARASYFPEQIYGHLPASVHASAEDSHPCFADEEVRCGQAWDVSRVTHV